MSLPKTMENCRRPRNHSNYISFERSSRENAKMQVLPNLSNSVKRNGHLSEILVFLP